MAANQDPDKAYFVFINQPQQFVELKRGMYRLHRVVRLDAKVYLLGRARSRQVLVNRLSKEHKPIIWLPSAPGPGSITPVGYIKKEGGKWCLYRGWEGRDARESIEVRARGNVINLVRWQQKVVLQGFEVITFQGIPSVPILFVPPISRDTLTILPSSDVLHKLSEFGLWASAAAGWEFRQEYEPAEENWHNAEEACRTIAQPSCSPDEYAAILYRLSNLCQRKGGSPKKINALRQRAAGLLGLPIISYYSSQPRVWEDSKDLEIPLHIEMSGQTRAGEKLVQRLVLNYACPELKIHKRYILSLQHPTRREKGKIVWQRQVLLEQYDIFKPWKYSVEATISLETNKGINIMYSYRDFIIIPKRRGRLQVEVEGDVGSLIADIEESQDARLQVKGDVGLMRITLLHEQEEEEQ